MADVIDAASAVVWPKRCMFCGGAMFENSRLTCDRCRDSLPFVNGKVCSKCGRGKSECTCSSATLYYDKAVAPFYFETGVKKCIHALKFRSHTEFADPLGEYMLKAFNEHYNEEAFDFITYVPLHPDDLKLRGYNQSRLLAEYISDKTKIPLKANIINKIYRTQKQSGTSPMERFGNVFGVFETAKGLDLSGMNILLVDDIETTGSTLSECGKMLFLAGAQRVCCLSAAVTKLKKKGRN
ncbi:MAG: ComF family protein [Clostridia bacterium]|nr:ComF family protein [Clostridia bacterium]